MRIYAWLAPGFGTKRRLRRNPHDWIWSHLVATGARVVASAIQSNGAVSKTVRGPRVSRGFESQPLR
jgi:hypothetical protein